VVDAVEQLRMAATKNGNVRGNRHSQLAYGEGRLVYAFLYAADFSFGAFDHPEHPRRSARDRLTAFALYTDRPLGRAGMTEAEVRRTDKPALIATRAMENVSRAYEKGETKGFMKILVDRESK
jgi:pyruvate/2-oxoglutarate dehydrogenase complex dihydrolipoamide dehydrogenase (E3) component